MFLAKLFRRFMIDDEHRDVMQQCEESYHDVIIYYEIDKNVLDLYNNLSQDGKQTILDLMKKLK